MKENLDILKAHNQEYFKSKNFHNLMINENSFEFDIQEKYKFKFAKAEIWNVIIEGTKNNQKLETFLKSQLLDENNMNEALNTILESFEVYCDFQKDNPFEMIFSEPFINENVNNQLNLNSNIVSKFSQTEIYLQAIEFQEILEKTDQSNLCGIELVDFAELALMKINPHYLILSEEDLEKLWFNENSSIYIEITITSNEIYNILSDNDFTWKEFSNFKHFNYLIFRDIREALSINLEFLKSKINKFFNIFNFFSSSNKGNFRYSRIFWALIFEDYGIPNDLIIHFLMDSDMPVPTICSYLECSPEVKNELSELNDDISHHTDNVYYILLNIVKFYLQRYFLFCMICGAKLNNNNFLQITCDNENCLTLLEENYTFEIYPFIKESRLLFSFHISSAANAIFSEMAQEVFEPFPSFYLKGLEFRPRAGFFDNVKKGLKDLKPHNENKDIEALKKDIQGLYFLCQNTDIENDSMLKDIITVQAENQYVGMRRVRLLQFILSTNKNQLKILKNQNAPFAPKPGLIQILINPPNSKEYDEFNALKKQYGSKFLFHGCSSSSCFSILRNGLVVLSGTHMMKVGQAHGPGIYCTDQIILASGYTYDYGYKPGIPFNSSKNLGNKNLIIPNANDGDLYDLIQRGSVMPNPFYFYDEVENNQKIKENELEMKDIQPQGLYPPYFNLQASNMFNKYLNINPQISQLPNALNNPAVNSPKKNTKSRKHSLKNPKNLYQHLNRNNPFIFPQASNRAVLPSSGFSNANYNYFAPSQYNTTIFSQNSKENVGKNIRIVFVVECISHPSIKHSSQIYVVPDHKYLSLRYLLIMDDRYQYTNENAQLEWNYAAQLNLIKKERLEKIQDRIGKILLSENTKKTYNHQYSKEKMADIKNKKNSIFKIEKEKEIKNKNNQLDANISIKNSDKNSNKNTNNSQKNLQEDLKEDYMKMKSEIKLELNQNDLDSAQNSIKNEITNTEIKNINSKNSVINYDQSQKNLVITNMKFQEENTNKNTSFEFHGKIGNKQSNSENLQIKENNDINENKKSLNNIVEEVKDQKNEKLNLIMEKVNYVKQETSINLKEQESTVNSSSNVSEMKGNIKVPSSNKVYIEENKLKEKENISLNSVLNEDTNYYLKNQYELLGASSNMNGVRFELKENNWNIWRLFIDIHKQEILSPLYNQFEELSKITNHKEELILEIKLKKNYPLSPPFIRIIWPKLLNSNNIFGEKGSISLDILSENKWSKDSNTHSLEMIIITILNELIESNISFSFKKTEEEFTIKEVKSEYNLKINKK